MLKLSQVGVEGRLVPFSGQIETGIQLHLIGPNGAGKSTLLARLAGMLPGFGKIYLSGTSIDEYSGQALARYRAYLCQQQPTVILMPVFQYIALHQPVGADENKLESTILYLAQCLKLSDKLNCKLTQLSGGEWQRVRLAAVLLQVWPAVNPQGRLLLLDEPTNSLDIAQKVALDCLLKEFCQSGGTVLICAHDLNHTLQQADQVWLLNRGNVVAQGTPLEVMEPTLLASIYKVNFYLHHSDNQRWLMTEAAL